MPCASGGKRHPMRRLADGDASRHCTPHIGRVCEHRTANRTPKMKVERTIARVIHDRTKRPAVRKKKFLALEEITKMLLADVTETARVAPHNRAVAGARLVSPGRSLPRSPRSSELAPALRTPGSTEGRRILSFPVADLTVGASVSPHLRSTTGAGGHGKAPIRTTIHTPRGVS